MGAFVIKKKATVVTGKKCRGTYLTKPHKEVLTGSLPTVSKGSGKTIVFIPSSE